MAVPRGKEPLRFYRASTQRMQEAKFLLFRGGYTTAAVYLAGYAAECILKALMLSREPASRHAETLATFRGAHAHAFDWIRQRLMERGAILPLLILRELTRIKNWTTHLRYDPVTIKRRDADAFLRAVQGVIQWADGSM